MHEISAVIGNCLPLRYVGPELKCFKTRLEYAKRIQYGVLCVSIRAYWAQEVLRIGLRRAFAYWAVTFLPNSTRIRGLRDENHTSQARHDENLAMTFMQDCTRKRVFGDENCIL